MDRGFFAIGAVAGHRLQLAVIGRGCRSGADRPPMALCSRGVGRPEGQTLGRARRPGPAGAGRGSGEGDARDSRHFRPALLRIDLIWQRPAVCRSRAAPSRARAVGSSGSILSPDRAAGQEPGQRRFRCRLILHSRRHELPDQDAADANRVFREMTSRRRCNADFSRAGNEIHLDIRSDHQGAVPAMTAWKEI